MNGYILISRSLLESDIWKKPPLYLKVWMYLLTKAQHTDYKQLKRGQVFTSVDEIRNACTYFVGNRKETPTKEQVYRVLRWMKVEISTVSRKRSEHITENIPNAPMITTSNATHGMVVTICNFNDYQDPNYYERNTERNTENIPKTFRKQRHANDINEECNKNDKNDNKEYSAPAREAPRKTDFDFFKDTYNRECSNLPSMKVVTEKRKTAIRKFLKEFTEEQFTEICREANMSSFLTGDNDRGWRADFDFIVRADKAASILEGGKYSKKKSTSGKYDNDEDFFSRTEG